MNCRGQSRFGELSGGVKRPAGRRGGTKGLAGSAKAPGGDVRLAAGKQENPHGNSPKVMHCVAPYKGRPPGCLDGRLLFGHIARKIVHLYSSHSYAKLQPETFKAQQVQEIQAKLEQLQSETGQLMLELTTLYGKYASLLQENISLKSRMGKLELKEAVVTTR
jgi:hypothetical protein